MTRFTSVSLIVAVAIVVAAGAPALAHPHVFVDAKAEIVFDGQGRISAVRNIWQFDEAFSSYATLNLDADGDGTFSAEELEPLAKINVESLQEFGFFTYLTVGEQEAAFVPPTEYFLTYENARLTLYYTLPLKEPAVLTAPAKLEVFDPEYFVAFTFVGDDPATLDGAPEGCTATFHPPQELDAQTMAILSAIPMDQRTIPEALVAAASVLANVIVVECEGAAMPIAAPEPPQPETLKPKPPSPFGVGTVDLPGGAWLTGPLGPFFIWIGQRQAEFYKALTDRFAEIRSDPRAALVLLGLSFLYGVFHAAGPGHGKAVITSYLFATGETFRRGVALSLASAFVQAFTAIAIVGAATLVFHAAAQTVTTATQWIEIGSYALIVLVGLWLVWTKTFGGGHHHHHRGAAESAEDRHQHEHDHDHSGADGHHHDHNHARHDHAASGASAPGRSSLAAALAAVLAVGIRPCTGAIIVLVFAFSLGMFGVGVLATLVMALGTGLTVAALATLAVTAHGFALRFAGADSIAAHRVVRGLEIAAAFLVLGFGIVLLGGALANGLPA